MTSSYLASAQWFIASAEALRPQSAIHWRRRRERYLGIAVLYSLAALSERSCARPMERG